MNRPRSATSIQNPNLHSPLSSPSMSRRGRAGSVGLDSRIKKLKKLAGETNAATAQYELGNLYVEKGDTKKALTYYKKAADNNNILAQMHLGNVYRCGLMGIPVDEQEAMKYYTKAANNSYPEASTQIALMLLDFSVLNSTNTYAGKESPSTSPPSSSSALLSSSPPSNPELENRSLIPILATAAIPPPLPTFDMDEEENEKEKDDPAKTNLSPRHQNRSPPLSPKDRIELPPLNIPPPLQSLDANISQTSPKSPRRFPTVTATPNSPRRTRSPLAIFSDQTQPAMLTKRGIQKDNHVAISHLYMAAKKGSERAMYILWWLSLHGIGCESSVKQSLDWLNQSTEKKYPFAIHTLGCLYDEGSNGVEKDAPAAVKLWNQSLALGVADSAFNLGVHYILNNDIRQAKGYLLVAAERGHVEAQFNLGLVYLDQSLSATTAALFTPREKEDETLDGGTASSPESHAGSPPTPSTSPPLSPPSSPSHGTPNASLITESLKWLGKCAEQRFRPAMINLAYIYQCGIVRPSQWEVIKWLRKAVELDNDYGDVDGEVLYWLTCALFDCADQEERVARINGKANYQSIGEEMRKEGEKYLAKAATVYSEAMLMTGLMIARGQLIDRAKKENGDTKSGTVIGMDVKREEIIEALQWIRKAANSGSSCAAVEMARIWHKIALNQMSNSFRLGKENAGEKFEEIAASVLENGTSNDIINNLQETVIVKGSVGRSLFNSYLWLLIASEELPDAKYTVAMYLNKGNVVTANPERSQKILQECEQIAGYSGPGIYPIPDLQ